MLEDNSELFANETVKVEISPHQRARRIRATCMYEEARRNKMADLLKKIGDNPNDFSANGTI